MVCSDPGVSNVVDRRAMGRVGDTTVAAGTESTPARERVPSTARRVAGLAVGIAVSAAFVWLIVRQSRMGSFASAFEGLSVPLLFAAVGVLALGYTARIVRWWWMLRALEPDLGLSRCVGPYLASMAVNNIVPFRAGDALRVVGFADQLRSPPMRVLGSVVVERVLDVAVLLGVFALCLRGLPGDVLPPGVVATAEWLGVVGVVGAACLVWLAPRLVALPQAATGGSFGFLTERRWWGVVARQLGHFGDALLLVRSARRALALVGLSIVAWVLEGATFVAVAAAFGSDFFSGAPWLSLATGTLATFIPSSPGYVGTFDYFAAQGFAAYGSTLSQAVAFVVTVHVLLWVSVTVAGAPFAILRALGVRRGHKRQRLRLSDLDG